MRFLSQPLFLLAISALLLSACASVPDTHRAPESMAGAILLVEPPEIRGTQPRSYVRPRVENEARQASREQTPSLTLPQDLSADEVIVTWGIAPQ